MAMVRMRDNVEAQPPLELAVFCKRQWPRLVATLTFLVRDTRTAEDLAQEAMTRVCQHWKTVARMEYPGVWVHRVAVNLAHTHNRREATRRKATTAFPEQDTAQDRTTEMVVRDAVRDLPERERVAIILRFFADLSVRDTAAAMRVSEANVKFLTHIAIKRLRETTPINIEEVADA
jgi:RNA polymerase sigma factor (sigma-70 family)